MFRILIIDDTLKQIENIKSNLLKMNNLDEKLKEKITNEFLSITHFTKPSEAEQYLKRVANQVTAPDFIICDVNFQGFDDERDNGRFRGLELTKFIVALMPNVPIILLTLYSTSDIQKELRKLMPIGVNTRWVYDFNKQGVLDDEWTTRFMDIFQFIVQNNIDDIRLSEQTRTAIYNTINNGQPIATLFQENNLEITYKERRFSLKSFFIAWLKFEKKPLSNDVSTEIDGSLGDLLSDLVAVPNEIRRTIFENLIEDYRNHNKYKDWLEEIQNAVKVAVKAFMAEDWAVVEQVRSIEFADSKQRTFFPIGKFLNMACLPISDGIYNIDSEAIQGQLINWLKARLFVLTIYRLFEDKKYQDAINSKHHGSYQRTNPFDFAIMAGLRNEVSNFNTHAVSNCKKETIKQYFYTFLKLQGKLRCQSAYLDDLPQDKLNDVCLIEEEKIWLEKDLSFLFV